MLRCLFLIMSFFVFSQFAKSGWKNFHLTGFTQGTTWHISYYAEDSLVSQEEIETALEHIDSCLSIYKPYSTISRWNRSATGLSVDEHFQAVVRKSKEIYNSTGGLFDITVLPLVNAWGFGNKKVSSLPDSSEIKTILNCTGSNRFNLNADRLIKYDSCLQLDVNGIAQGYSVDLLAEVLERKVIKNYMVEIGGELRVSGRKQPAGKKMTIAIEAPGENEFDEGFTGKIIYLDHGAITTSGSYRKYYQSGSKKISHLLNPKTGYPVDNELISVTVWAKDAITADGYDNALMAMGLNKALVFMNTGGEMQAWFIYRKKDGSIADTATTGFYKLLKE